MNANGANDGAEINFARPDFARKNRTGFDEVVFCQGKNDRHLAEIFRRLYEANGEVLGTRASKNQAEILQKEFPDLFYDEISGVVKIEKKSKKRGGLISVCSAGTADIFVAEEASLCAEFFGANVQRFYDVGVSCLSRIFSCLDEIRKSNAIICAAGMEASLPTVLGGLVEVPVIAVPTSVGYGASFSGVAALLSMLNSCGNGISVVNIDNGFGAAYNAAMINRLASGKKPEEKK